MTDRSIERLLQATSRSIEYPPVPDLRGRVLAAVDTPAATGGLMARPAFVTALAVAVLILVAALAVTPSREAIARFFGVEGSRIEFLPTPLAGTTPTPFVPATPVVEAVPVPVRLAELPGLAGFEAALPEVDQARTGSFLIWYGDQAVAVHHYPDFDLWQTRLHQHAGFGKEIRPEGSVEEVEVAGRAGMWVTGAEHYVHYYRAAGGIQIGSHRVVERSTLIWRTEAFFYRIETDLPLAEALRIAGTLP